MIMDSVPDRKKAEGAKLHFLITGFTQTAGVRTYAFESRTKAEQVNYTVEVNLALISRYGIRIQDLPLLCRELLQQAKSGEAGALVLTEQRMCSHAEKLALAREEARRRKKPSRRLANAQTEWPAPLG